MRSDKWNGNLFWAWETVNALIEKKCISLACCKLRTIPRNVLHISEWSEKLAWFTTMLEKQIFARIIGIQTEN